VYFRSREKDGGHTILSAVAENLTTQTNFTALFSSREPDLLPIKVVHRENGEIRAFYCCDLDLDPMTFIYELDLYLLKM